MSFYKPLPEIYGTSFCNKPHRMSDGMPVEHECYCLKPELLRIEAHPRYDGEQVHESMIKSGPHKACRTKLEKSNE